MARANNSAPAFAVGVMSGTSVDGIDAALFALSQARGALQLEVAADVHCDFPPPIAQAIHELMTPGENEIERAGALHKQLGACYADAVAALLKDADNAPRVIGCHGQTIRHRPQHRPPFSWQLGCGATLAARTGVAVVADFRSADMARGGQGAPFAPFLHREIFTDAAEHRAIVNLGGIANLTHLPNARAQQTLRGFDTGPGNALLDLHCRRHQSRAFDSGGAWAAEGEVNRALLAQFLQDAYFAQTPPKSTGREVFNAAWLDKQLEQFAEQHPRAELRPVDVQATLCALTAQSVAAEVKRLQPRVDALYVCGGGVHNQTLMQMLGARVDCKVRDTGAIGLAPAHVECATFAWLAWRTLQGLHSGEPSVTGAANSSVAGAVYFP